METLTESTQKKPKRTAAKVIIDVIMSLLALTIVLAMVIGKYNGKPVFLFRHSCMWVITGSMEPTIEAQSYVLLKKSDGSDVKKGDVITFLCNKQGSQMYGKLVTHRVYDVTEGGSFLTKGDSIYSGVDDWTVAQSDVVGVYVKNLNALTFIGRLFFRGYGLILCIALFAFLCAFCYIPDIVAGIKEAQKEKEDERRRQIDLLVKEEVERLKAENGNLTSDASADNQKKS